MKNLILMLSILVSMNVMADTTWYSDGSWSQSNGNTTWNSDGSWS